MYQVVKEQTMDYNSFVNTIRQVVKDRMGDDFDIRIYKVIKNNSVQLDSLVVLKKGRNFAPNIYLMPYYEAYLEGTPVNEIADRLCCIYRHCSIPVSENDFTYSFNDMKPYIFYRLVSFEKNLNLLDQIPHIRYLDLAITFHCLVRNDDDGIGTIRITNEHMKLWNITLEELDALAIQNTRRLFPASIKSMDEILKNMLNDEFVNSGEEELPNDMLDRFIDSSISSDRHKMYILTNQKGINGASCLLYSDIIRNFSDKVKTDLYILPSSIHEVILIPKEKDIQIETLKTMVKDVNMTQVSKEEVLSDQVYVYSRDKDIILL